MKSEKNILLLLLGLFCVVSYFTFNKKVDIAGDNATYYLLGKSIEQGTGYTNLHTVDQSPGTHFPPGYPFIIALGLKVFGDGVIGIKILNHLFLLGTVLALFFIIKKVTSGNVHMAVCASLLCLFNANFLEFSSMMMSELSFTFFLTLSLYFFINIKSDFTLKDRYFLLFLITLSASYYIRTLGITLLAGASLYFLISKRWKHMIITISSFVLFFLPWFLRSKSIGGANHLGNLFAFNKLRPETGEMISNHWLPRIFRNSERYITKEIPTNILNNEVDYAIPGGIGDWVIGISLIILIVLGLVSLPKYRSFLFGIIGSTFAILLIWPEIWVGPRFILPILPIFIFGLVQFADKSTKWAAIWLKKKGKSMTPRLGVYAILIILPFGIPSINQLHQEAIQQHEIGTLGYKEVAEWSNINLPKDALVACRKPSYFYHYGQRHVVRYLYSKDPEKFLEHLINTGVTHIVFDELGYSSYQEYLLPAANYYSGKFVLLHTSNSGRTQIYEFRPDLGYFGERKGNLRHGHGTFIWLDGNRYEGEWRDGKKHGKGKISGPQNKIISEGTWENGSFLDTME